MMNYTNQLEQQNEELQKKLAAAQEQLDKVAGKSAFEAMAEAVQSSKDYAWTIHCNLAVTIKDSGNVSHKKSNMIAAQIMKHFYNVDMNEDSHYKDLMSN